MDRDGRLTWTNVPALVQRAVSKCPIRHGATAGTAAAGVGRMRKKLKLNRETLRRLDASRLVTVAGGLRSILPPPPIPTVDGFTCAGPCVTLTCLTHCDACGSLGCELA